MRENEIVIYGILSDRTILDTAIKKLIPAGLNNHFFSTAKKQEEKDVIKELYKKYFKRFNHG